MIVYVTGKKDEDRMYVVYTLKHELTLQGYNTALPEYHNGRPFFFHIVLEEGGVPNRLLEDNILNSKSSEIIFIDIVDVVPGGLNDVDRAGNYIRLPCTDNSLEFKVSQVLLEVLLVITENSRFDLLDWLANLFNRKK